MISEDELAAIVVALQTLSAPQEPIAGTPSRWKLAARQPDLELEDVRSL